VTNSKQYAKSPLEVVGLIPAAGKATRIAPLPCSKELYPLGFCPAEESTGLRPKVVCHYLLEKMRLADVSKAYIVLREGKWDIPAYLGDGKMLDMHLAYLMMDLPFGVPYTLEQAYPFSRDATVAFGFPDIIFQPDDAFEQLLARQVATNADIVLGLFPTDKPQKSDMVGLDEEGRVREIVIKSRQTNLRYAWIIAVWTPVFTGFMHEYLPSVNAPEQRELFLGHVIQAALDTDLQIESVIYPHGTYLDIGTPEDLAKAVSSEIVSRVPIHAYSKGMVDR